MKKVLTIVAYLIIGYLVGSYFPVRGFFGNGSSGPSISGSAELQVTVLRPDNSPATGLEVDVATQIGQPGEGGMVETDGTGVATFHIKPGTYYIFFNDTNFPKDLLHKDTPQVTVSEGLTTKQTVHLQAK